MEFRLKPAAVEAIGIGGGGGTEGIFSFQFEDQTNTKGMS